MNVNLTPFLTKAIEYKLIISNELNLMLASDFKISSVTKPYYVIAICMYLFCFIT